MFIVIELQKNTDGRIGNLVYVYANLNQAYQKYYLVLSAAAVSELPRHSAVLLREDGSTIEHCSFSHGENENDMV